MKGLLRWISLGGSADSMVAGPDLAGSASRRAEARSFCPPGASGFYSGMLSLDFLDDVRRMNKRQVRGERGLEWAPPPPAAGSPGRPPGGDGVPWLR